IAGSHLSFIVVAPALKTGPKRRAGRFAGIANPFAMGIAPGRLYQRKIDASFNQYLRLLTKISAQLVLGELQARSNVWAKAHGFTAGGHSEVGDRAGNQHGTAAGYLVAGCARQQNGPAIEFTGQIAEPQGLKIMSSRRVGICRNYVDANLKV